MNVLGLAIRNIAGNTFKSWVVGLCAAMMAGFVIMATLVLGGAQRSLDLALQRLGADVIVVPSGAEAKVEDALLMGAPVSIWMPKSVIGQIAHISGVDVVSPQMYLATLRGASCCSVPEMFLIAYDPDTDFTLRPWLSKNLKDGLHLGEAIGGAYVYLPPGDDKIKIYGYGIDLKGNLTATGTGLDQTMFLTFETAQEVARLSYTQAEQPLRLRPDSVSAALVKLKPGADPQTVAGEIWATIPGVMPITSANLFRTQREQMSVLLNSVMALLTVVWVVAMILAGLVFSIAVNERRREIGVLRALGASRQWVLRSLLAEALLLALAGGIAGSGLVIFITSLFRNAIIRLTHVPFLIPEPLALAAVTAQALGLALVSVIVAASIPAMRINLLEPAVAVRE